jgi:hypothetical protein
MLFLNIGRWLVVLGVFSSLGGLGAWVAREHPFLLENANVIAVAGLALLALGSLITSFTQTERRSA